MELNKTTKRIIAASRPFSVVEIKNDPSITKVNGKQSSYNIVGGNGSGIAEFGCAELAALWFCEAANRYADEIYSRRSTKAVNSGDAAKLHEAISTLRTALKEIRNDVLDMVMNHKSEDPDSYAHGLCLSIGGACDMALNSTKGLDNGNE